MSIIRLNDLLCNSYGSPMARDRNGHKQEVFLSQGSLDGACGIYCLAMGLLMLGLSDREQIDSSTGMHGNTRTARLLKATSRHGPFVQKGTSLKDLQKDLKSTCGDKVPCEAVFDIPGTKIRRFVERKIDSNRPVILGVEWADGAHWILVVGIEYDDETMQYPKRLLLLDPDGPEPDMCSWNGAIEAVGTGGHYPYRWPGHSKVGFFAALSM